MGYSPFVGHSPLVCNSPLMVSKRKRLKGVDWTVKKIIFIFIVTLFFYRCEPLKLILKSNLWKNEKSHWNLYYSIKNTFPNQNYFILILSIRYKSTSHCRNHVRSQQNISFLSLLMDFLLVLPKKWCSTNLKSFFTSLILSVQFYQHFLNK